MKSTIRIINGLWMVGMAFAITTVLWIMSVEYPEDTDDE